MLLGVYHGFNFLTEKFMSLLFCAASYCLCYFFQIVFLVLEKKQKMVQTLYLKGLASATFVVLGAISFIKTNNPFFATFILIGLVFDALADVVFNLRFAFKKIEHLSFASGTLLFFVGHIFYLVALIPQINHQWIYLIIGLGFGAIVQIVFLIILENVSLAYRIYGIIYIAMVSTMTAMGIGNLVTNLRTPGSTLFAIGAVFFLISDILLIFNTFSHKKIYPVRVISFMTYYTGQLLIATSLFIL